MKIWLINDYNMLPEHGHLNRNYYLGKYLQRYGHEPIAFAGSHPHNTDLQLINNQDSFCIYREDPFPWVLIKTSNYGNSHRRRILSMFRFYFNMRKASKHFEKPDAIIGSSAHPLDALLAIQLGKRYNAKKIVEIRDFWPESIVAYGLADRNNPIIKLLYRFERYLYLKADEIVLTMENGYQYFKDHGLDKVIPETKVHYVNNGVDLEVFENNKELYTINDDDLKNEELFKVIYTGSIRHINNVGLLLDVAKAVKISNVKFLIWGAGNELDALQKRIVEENITNVVLKGYIDKKYIPYLTSCADLNISHGTPSIVLKYGLSANKLFDYAAAGKPILTDFYCGMNPATVYGAGISVDSGQCEEIAKAIDYFATLGRGNPEYQQYCDNAKHMASMYDYKNLAKRMLSVINGQND